MLSKAEIKRLSRYKQSKFRNQDNLFVVEGEKVKKGDTITFFCDIILMAF